MHFSRRTILRAAAAATALLAAPRGAFAQTYPDRPIRLIVPFPPGGEYDTLGRPWADRIKPHLGTVVIENIGGGGASLGAAAAARARPDGYTLLLGGTLPHVNESLLKAKPLTVNDRMGAISRTTLDVMCHNAVCAERRACEPGAVV